MALGPIGIVLQLVEVLEGLGVRYAIGGSLASSAHGVARASQDADIVAELEPRHAAPLVTALKDRFYVDEKAVRRAIERRASFNLIHLVELFKLDVFVPRSIRFDREQLIRRQVQVIAADPERRAYLVSAEDIVLQKLRWFRMGGGVSERQWRDVLGVLKVQGHRLDLAYLRSLAGEAGLVDLLERALAESAGPLG